MSTLAAGTPLFSLPPKNAGGMMKNVKAVLPSATTTSHKNFMGVTVRSGEEIGTDGASVVLQRNGVALIRVKGPVSHGDTVGLSPEHDYLEKDKTPAVGVVQEDHTGGTTVALLLVRIGQATSSGGDARWS